MAGNGKAFLKGGIGCFALFAVFGVIALLAGGYVRADAGGIGLLFIIGGVIGLVINAIYQKGRRDAADRRDDEP